MRFHSITLAVLLLGSISTAYAGTVDEGLDAYNAENYEQAFSIWEPLAKNGDPEAQYYLGYLYQTGAGAPQSSSEALKWYFRAAEQGHLTARYYMNTMMDMIEARQGRHAQPKM